MKKIGLYYYPWYKKETWAEGTILHTPEIGYYDSSHKDVINYHIDIFKYINVDYIVIEFVPFNDWKFNFIYKNTIKIIEELKLANIPYTLLIDPIGVPNWKKFYNFDNFFQFLLDNYLHSTVYFNNKPLYLLCGPPYNIGFKLREKYNMKYSFYFVHYNECYNKTLMEYFSFYNNNVAILDDPVNFFSNKKYSFSYDQNTYEFFKDNNYFQFWDETDKLRNMNGFSPVIPGYDDLLRNRKIQRAPVVKRRQGLTLVNQIKKVTDINAAHILLYSFNEFFEATNIEPTLEYGDFYVELTRHLVKQVHNGEPITFPDGLKPHKGQIIYLSPEIELGAQRHEDKIPRWDGDYWVAEILHYDESKVIGNHVVIENVKVKNSGIKTWAIDTENAPIFLGAKLLDSEKNVLSEGRASTGERDILPGEKFSQTIKVEIPENSRAKFVEIGLVWENEFWFDNLLLIELRKGKGE